MNLPLIKPLASIFIEPLSNYADSLGLDSNYLLNGIWDKKSKWIESDNWGLAARRLEEMSKDPLACYFAGFSWVQDILRDPKAHYSENKVVLGRTYTIEREYLKNGKLRITMHHAPNMEPPRSGVLFNLGGLNGIARLEDPYGQAILIKSQCEELPPLPLWHPEVEYGDSDIFELT